MNTYDFRVAASGPQLELTSFSSLSGLDKASLLTHFSGRGMSKDMLRRSTLALVRLGDQVVSWWAFFKTSAQHGLVSSFTDPRYRGKGYSKQSGEKIIQHAKARGTKKLSGFPTDAAGRSLYSSLGFSLDIHDRGGAWALNLR